MPSELNPVLDSREPKNVQELFHEFYPNGTIEMLDSGDLVCQKYSVAIERKVNNDYVGSILGTKEEPGRLWEQVERMEETHQHNYIIIIGSYDDLSDEDKARFSKKSWDGSQISLMCRNNIKFVHVKTNREFFEKSKTIFEKSDGIKRQRCNLKKVVKNDRAIPIGCLYQVPGIGLTHSRNIVESLNIQHARELSDMTMDDLLSVDGIGKVRAERIKREF
jgi:ERCC4-type nuclease